MSTNKFKSINKPLHVRDTFMFERGNVAGFETVGGETGVNGPIGPNSNPGGTPDVPFVIGVYSSFGDSSLSASGAGLNQIGNIRLIDSETLFNAGTATNAATVTIDSATSIVAVRGAHTIGPYTTFGGGFLYGLQGKAIVRGTISAPQDVAVSAVQGQLDLSAAVGITGKVAALWLDAGATFSAAIISSGEANVDLAVLTNTAPGTAINSVFRVAANATYLFDISNASYSPFWFAGAPTTLDGGIAINTPAGVRYIATYATHA